MCCFSFYFFFCLLPRRVRMATIYRIHFYRRAFNKNQYTATRALQYGKFVDKTPYRYVGIAEKAFIWNNFAAWYTCSSSNSVSAQLARGITRCRISGFSRSVSILLYLKRNTKEKGSERNGKGKQETPKERATPTKSIQPYTELRECDVIFLVYFVKAVKALMDLYIYIPIFSLSWLSVSS